MKIKRKFIDLFMPKLTENFQIIIGGDSHEIDINTLVVTLSHLNTVVSEANRVLSGDKKEIELKVIAHNQGSFEIDLAVHTKEVWDTVKALFNHDDSSYTANLVTIVGGAYGLCKFLLGRKPKELEKKGNQTTIVTNEEGDVKVFNANVLNVYLDSPKTIQAISQTMKALESDEHVDSFNFESKKQKVKIERDLFDILAKDEKLIQNEINLKQLNNVTLTIVSPDFDFKRQWQCYFNGEKKSFVIDSIVLRSEVLDNGLKFGVGDAITVDIEIKQVWDKKYNAFVNKSFSITNYHSYIPKPVQSKFDI